MCRCRRHDCHGSERRARAARRLPPHLTPHAAASPFTPTRRYVAPTRAASHRTPPTHTTHHTTLQQALRVARLRRISRSVISRISGILLLDAAFCKPTRSCTELCYCLLRLLSSANFASINRGSDIYMSIHTYMHTYNYTCVYLYALSLSLSLARARARALSLSLTHTGWARAS